MAWTWFPALEGLVGGMVVVRIASSAGQIPGATELASRAHRMGRWTPRSAILSGIDLAMARSTPRLSTISLGVSLSSRSHT